MELAWDAAWGQSPKDHASSASELLALLTRLERAGPAATATEGFEGDGGAARTDAMDALMDAVAGLAARGLARFADGERFLDRCLVRLRALSILNCAKLLCLSLVIPSTVPRHN